MPAVEAQFPNTTRPLQVRVPVDVWNALQEMKDKSGVSIAELASELLVNALVAGDSHPEVLAKAFLRYIAKVGDPTEMIQLEETAKFRGQSTMELIVGHIRFGVQQGTIY